MTKEECISLKIGDLLTSNNVRRSDKIYEIYHIYEGEKKHWRLIDCKDIFTDDYQQIDSAFITNFRKVTIHDLLNLRNKIDTHIQNFLKNEL